MALVEKIGCWLVSVSHQQKLFILIEFWTDEILHQLAKDPFSWKVKSELLLAQTQICLDIFAYWKSAEFEAGEASSEFVDLSESQKTLIG